MLSRILFFAYGLASYSIFLATFLYAIGFIGNFGVPRTLDGPPLTRWAAPSPSTSGSWASSRCSTA